MASGVSARLLASVLEQLRREKEVRLTEERELEQQAIRAEEQSALRALDDAKRRRGELEAHAAKDKEKLEELANEARIAEEKAADEARTGALVARMQDFRGNSDEAIRERLLAEGFSESLTQDQLHLRTLDQQLGNELGLRAAFTRFGDDNPFDLEKSSNAAAQEGPSLDYVRTESPDSIYRGTDPNQATEEDARRRDAEEGVRKGLGLDIELGLTYGRAK